MTTISVSKTILKCQICNNSNLRTLLFLGYLPPVNLMPPIDSTFEEQPTFPLELVRCEKCTLVQISSEVNQTILFSDDYPYLSGSTKVLRENFSNLCQEAQQYIKLAKEDLIVDIGSNDGTLLSNFQKAGYSVLGIEPTQASKVAKENGINTWKLFFNAETAHRIEQEYKAPKIITAANVFAHISDINEIAKTISELLPNDGVFISESHYLIDLVDELQYDTIYHEHLRYYSLESLSNLLKMHGLHVFHARYIPSHGGSIRVYAAKNSSLYAIQPSVNEILIKEKQAGFVSGEAFKQFKKDVFRSKYDLLQLLSSLKSDNLKIYGIGAPSRASTLINFVGLGQEYLDCILEISTSKKLNKYVPGTNIPVLDEKKLYEDQPDYVLLLSWHIADELIPVLKQKGYKGKFIVPLPNVTVQ
jgi:2-polyprenyl-3-methyl-5-hydroxy-6-metoxy-1,4-benzoquinol methylase